MTDCFHDCGCGVFVRLNSLLLSIAGVGVIQVYRSFLLTRAVLLFWFAARNTAAVRYVHVAWHLEPQGCLIASVWPNWFLVRLPYVDGSLVDRS